MTNITPSFGDQPIAGYYQHRLVRGGPWLAVRIWHDVDRRDPDFPDEQLDRSPIWRAELDGREVEIEKVWPFCAKRPIERSDYVYLLADRDHARRHRPDSPEANPERGVDLGSMRPLF